jgi:hypothetical protein
MKERHQQEINEFPMFFAFGNQQFEEGIRKLGLEPSDTDKIYNIGAGGYIRKTDAKRLQEIFDRHERELRNAMANEKFAYDAFDYELGNHEYVITYDITDTLNALGFTIEEVENDEMLSDALNKACKKQKEWYALHG